MLQYSKKKKNKNISNRSNDGIWTFTTEKGNNIRVCFVDNIFQSDLKIYYVSNRFQAKWINISELPTHARGDGLGF